LFLEGGGAGRRMLGVSVQQRVRRQWCDKHGRRRRRPAIEEVIYPVGGMASCLTVPCELDAGVGFQNDA
jgi:hypothetical protein